MHTIKLQQPIAISCVIPLIAYVCRGPDMLMELYND